MMWQRVGRVKPPDHALGHSPARLLQSYLG